MNSFKKFKFSQTTRLEFDPNRIIREQLELDSIFNELKFGQQKSVRLPLTIKLNSFS